MRANCDPPWTIPNYPTQGGNPSVKCTFSSLNLHILLIPMLKRHNILIIYSLSGSFFPYNTQNHNAISSKSCKLFLGFYQKLTKCILITSGFRPTVIVRSTNGNDRSLSVMQTSGTLSLKKTTHHNKVHVGNNS